MDKNLRSVGPNDWKLIDGKWVTKIPFECDNDEDVIIDLADDQFYITINQPSFDALEDGYTLNNECVIVSSERPQCSMTFDIKKAKDTDVEIVYDINGKAMLNPNSEKAFRITEVAEDEYINEEGNVVKK